VTVYPTASLRAKAPAHSRKHFRRE
jgi:hypothetical protein